MSNKALIEAGEKAFALLFIMLNVPNLATKEVRCAICHRPPDHHKKTCIYGQLVKEWDNAKANA